MLGLRFQCGKAAQYHSVFVREFDFKCLLIQDIFVMSQLVHRAFCYLQLRIIFIRSDYRGQCESSLPRLV